jgi:hypothetical protein
MTIARALLGAATLVEAADASSACITGTDGFGGRGSNIFGVSEWNGNASGRSNGSAITMAATAN